MQAKKTNHPIADKLVMFSKKQQQILDTSPGCSKVSNSHYNLGSTTLKADEKGNVSINRGNYSPMSDTDLKRIAKKS